MNASSLKSLDQVRKAREAQRAIVIRQGKLASDKVKAAREAVVSAEGELRTALDAKTAFDKEFPPIEAAPPAPASQTRIGRGKRGPAKKTAAAKTAKKQVAAKTASPKKTAKKVSAKPASKASKAAAAKGRAEVDAGQRPPIKHAMCRVIGDKQMNAQEVFDKITEKNWLPASNNPRAYIGNILSAQKDLFPPVQRGIYRRADNWEELLKPEARGGKKAAEAKAPKAAKTAKAPKAAAAKTAKNGTKAEETKAAAPEETKAASTETLVTPAPTKDILEEASDMFQPAATA